METKVTRAARGSTPAQAPDWQASLSSIFGQLVLECVEREFALEHAYFRSGGGDLVIGAGPPLSVRKSPSHGPARKDFISVFMVEEGRVHIRHAGNKYDLIEGQIAVFDQTQELFLDHVTPYRIMSLLLPRTVAASFSAARMAAFNRPIDAQFGAARALNLLVRDVPLHFGASMNAPTGINAVMNVISYAFHELIANGGDVGDEDWRFVKARQYVNSHFKNAALNRDDVAMRVGVSVRTLSRILAKQGVSVSDLIAHVRIAHAQKLLSKPAYAAVPVATIAQECGFNETAQFSREFKERIGIPPGRYRSVALSVLS